MSEGWSSAQPNKTLPQASPAGDYTDVQEDRFSVALTGLVLGASQAEAGYYSYSHCCTVSRPVTIRVWDDYSYSYFYKTVYRDYRVCQASLTLGPIEGRLFPPGGSPFLFHTISTNLLEMSGRPGARMSQKCQSHKAKGLASSGRGRDWAVSPASGRRISRP
jgi:hypothetical protein